MYKYIEITNDTTNEVVERIDVTDRSERSIEKAITGILMNLNTNSYSVGEKTSEIKLETK